MAMKYKCEKLTSLFTIVGVILFFVCLLLFGGCASTVGDNRLPSRDPFTLCVSASLVSAATAEPTTASATVTLQAPTPLLPLAEPDIATSTTKTTDTVAATATLKASTAKKKDFWSGAVADVLKFLAGVIAGKVV